MLRRQITRSDRETPYMRKMSGLMWLWPSWLSGCVWSQTEAVDHLRCDQSQSLSQEAEWEAQHSGCSGGSLQYEAVRDQWWRQEVNTLDQPRSCLYWALSQWQTSQIIKFLASDGMRWYSRTSRLRCYSEA